MNAELLSDEMTRSCNRSLWGIVDSCCVGSETMDVKNTGPRESAERLVQCHVEPCYIGLTTVKVSQSSNNNG